MSNDPEFKDEDGTHLPFPDKSFDFVVSLDVFEHIVQLDREKFLSELCRVSKKGCIISFPQNKIYVKDAEERINEYYKTMSGQDFVWLQEHIENGLPNIDTVNTFLTFTGYRYFSFCHGDIKNFEKMWYCHFDMVFAPEIAGYRKTLVGIIISFYTIRTFPIIVIVFPMLFPMMIWKVGKKMSKHFGT